MLSGEAVHPSHNQRSADKFKGSCWHNRTVRRQDCVCSCVVKAVFHCSATLGVYPHACKSSVGTTATCILILKKVRLCANVHWCVCVSLRVFCLRKQPSDSNRESRRKNAILFDVLKSSLILSCLFESSSQNNGQRGKISRA